MSGHLDSLRLGAEGGSPYGEGDEEDFFRLAVEVVDADSECW